MYGSWLRVFSGIEKMVDAPKSSVCVILHNELSGTATPAVHCTEYC